MTRLYLGNVSNKVDSSELKELLSECGKIKFFDVKDGSGYMVNILFIFRNSKLLTKQKKQ
jgi:RNA recognition motif-containing protein